MTIATEITTRMTVLFHNYNIDNDDDDDGGNNNDDNNDDDDDGGDSDDNKNGNGDDNRNDNGDDNDDNINKNRNDNARKVGCTVSLALSLAECQSDPSKFDRVKEAMTWWKRITQRRYELVLG